MSHIQGALEEGDVKEVKMEEVETSSPVAPQRPACLNVETLAFGTALFVSFVDMMGPQFTVPVLVPYGQWIGAGLNTVALFGTVRGLAAMVSNVWMSRLSDALGGRKLVSIISVVGCTAGYAIQGMAGFYDHGTMVPIVVFAAGRFIVGFFCGMTPVLQAYVTELSVHDSKLLTRRMVAMNVASQVYGVVLMPLAGIVATVGLQVPFFLCAVTGVFALIFVVLFFKEAADIQKAMAGGEASTEQTPHQSGTEPAAEATAPAPKHKEERGSSEGDSSDTRVAPLLDPFDDMESASFRQREADRQKNVWLDPVLMLIFWAFVARMLMFMGGSFFLMPLMLKQPSFGITGASEEEFLSNVAQMVGFAVIPLGVCQLFSATALFTPLTTRLGERPVITMAALCATIIFPLFGFWADKFWKVAMLNGVLGVCQGFMSPALGPLNARYASKIYPTRLALAQGIPMMGLSLSSAFNQNLLALLVWDESDLRPAWIAVSGFAGLYLICFFLAHYIATSRLAALTQPVAEGS